MRIVADAECRSELLAQAVATLSAL